MSIKFTLYLTLDDVTVETFTNSLHSHWLLRVYMASNNETVFHQNPRAGNIVKIYDIRG